MVARPISTYCHKQIARKMSVPSIAFANGHFYIRVMAINSHDSIENTNRKH